MSSDIGKDDKDMKNEGIQDEREIRSEEESAPEPQKEEGIKPLASEVTEPPPKPTEALPDGSRERMEAEALDAGETPPAPPEREQISQSYWSLVWWKFKKNRLAVFGGILIVLFYLVCLFFAEFFAPYRANREADFLEARPTWPHFIDEEGSFHLRPFVYGLEEQVDVATRTRSYVIDTSQRYPIRFFVPGQ